MNHTFLPYSVTRLVPCFVTPCLMVPCLRIFCLVMLCCVPSTYGTQHKDADTKNPLNVEQTAAQPAMTKNAIKALSVTDYENQLVALRKPARRIIALAPHIVENLFSAGLGDKVIGVVDHSDYPDAAQNLPRIGSATGISLEKIIALKPDLVIYWRGGSDTKLADRLTRLGIPVYADNPRTLADISRSIRDFATLGGTTPTANARLTAFETTLQTLNAQRAMNINRVSVFYQIGHQPLRTLNGQHFVTDVITLCGGRNIFAHEDSIAPIVSLEALLAADPDIILVGTHDLAALQPPPRWLTLKSLWATQEKQYHAINPDWLHRPTLRTGLAAKAVCQHIQKATQKASSKTSLKPKPKPKPNPTA